MVADDDPQQPQPDGAAAREARVRREARPHMILLRHGEPDWAPNGGPSVEDPGLTAFGHRQAEAAAQHLADQKIDALYVSPYRRSQETAQPLAQATGLPIVTVEGLAEVGVAVNGLSQEDVDRYFVEGSRRPLSEHWDGWPGAETFHEFHERVTTAVADVLGRHGMQPQQEHDFTVWDLEGAAPNVAIVAHGGTNAVALTHLLDLDPVPWEWLRFESELTAYSVVQGRNLGPRGLVWSLQAFGMVDHLIDAGLRTA
jgi:probable phosphoglycerate mutase